MRWIKNTQGYLLAGAQYEVLIRRAQPPVAEISFDGRVMAELAMVSALENADAKEHLTNARILAMEEIDGGLGVTLGAESDLWQERRFEWKFYPDHVTYRHFAAGSGKLGRCYFFSSGRPGMYDDGTSDGYHTNAAFLTPHYRTFNVNLANVREFDISQPGFAGIGRSECVGKSDYMNVERWHGIFSPAPLVFAFYHGDAVMSVGIGAKPGDYRFNGLEYSGCLKAASCFYVHYEGFTQAEGAFASPEAALHFDYSPFGCLRRYIEWIDRRGYGTQFRFPEAKWHRGPIFCGWAEQTALREPGVSASERATQANYEAWMDELDRRGVPVRTIVIDDKWQKDYGRFEVDTRKWPDMPGFVRRAHEKGRRVLLWIPGYQAEGVPKEYCALDEQDNPVMALPGLEAYDAMVRDEIVALIRQTDIDGFKEDWIGRTGHPGLKHYGALHGIEMLRRFQFVVHDALHSVKPDGLLETQTPNPLLRESSDMLRLNDIWFATRELPEMMRDRARIARMAGWQLLDCDNAGATIIPEWIQYQQLQPKLGVPSLYFLTETESSHEPMTRAQCDYMSALWREYIERNGLAEE